jgi:hypothetical protein
MSAQTGTDKDLDELEARLPKLLAPQHIPHILKERLPALFAELRLSRKLIAYFRRPASELANGQCPVCFLGRGHSFPAHAPDCPLDAYDALRNIQTPQ